jgi:hypothetical protein
MSAKKHRFSFGDNYYYDFNLAHTFTQTRITTVFMVSTNVRKMPTSTIDPHIPELIDYLAKLCVENDANYDGYHSYLVPYSYTESYNIADHVNAAIQSIKSSTT